ncbi:hypothetical protein [Maridesulfovibrio sp.]|nr:hypothetical protein [Maridesulfovibrio sp.]
MAISKNNGKLLPRGRDDQGATGTRISSGKEDVSYAPNPECIKEG